MAWIYLIIAGSLEVAWTYAMKLSEGFTRPWPTLVMALTMGASLGLLTIAVRTLPLGTAYAVWTSIGRLAPSSLASPRSASRRASRACRGGPYRFRNCHDEAGRRRIAPGGARPYCRSSSSRRISSPSHSSSASASASRNSA